MQIHVVKEGETITSVANQYDVIPENVISDNELPNPDNLVVGQAIVILHRNVIHTVAEGETVASIAEQYKISENQILMNNPKVAAQEGLFPGQVLVISYEADNETDGQKLANLVINGYAYPFINRTDLKKTLPFLTYLSIFTYGFTPEGELIPPELGDEELIAIALEFGVGPIMMLAPMTPERNFSSELAHNMFSNTEGQNTLINNIVENMNNKNYQGLDIDFEYILPQDKQLFVNFLQNLKNKLEPLGYILMVALAPKTSSEQAGLLYEAHDYALIGPIADKVLLMTYEWGYTFGPPMATSPVNNMRVVLNYGVSVIPPAKILMGVPNYSYDWPLPFVQGETAATSQSNQVSVANAAKFNATIQFDEAAQSPFYNYSTEQGVDHVVWFDDARSMEAKLRLIPEYSLNGAGIWQIMNFFPQLWLVVNSLFTVQKPKII